MESPLRDSRANAEYFAKYRGALDITITFGEEDRLDLEMAKNKPAFYATSSMSLYRARLGEVRLAYSIGKPVEEVKGLVSPLLDAYTRAWVSDSAYLPAETLANRHDIGSTRHIYTDAIAVLSLAVLADADDERSHSLLDAVGNRGVDGLYDRIARVFEPHREIAEAPAFAKPWAKLVSAFDADAVKRPALVASFLKNWYPNNRSAYWAGEAETIPLGGVAYGGYWSFEAAAVVKILNVDDSSFRDDPFYPRDLVES
jgi:hypothetical protein